jgi:hypothetical protein
VRGLEYDSEGGERLCEGVEMESGASALGMLSSLSSPLLSSPLLSSAPWCSYGATMYARTGRVL